MLNCRRVRNGHRNWVKLSHPVRVQVDVYQVRVSSTFSKTWLQAGQKRKGEEPKETNGSEKPKKGEPQKQPEGWFELKVNTSVYVTGLPEDVTMDEIVDVFQKVRFRESICRKEFVGKAAGGGCSNGTRHERVHQRTNLGRHHDVFQKADLAKASVDQISLPEQPAVRA
jgi:hypothetical protein